MAADAAVTVEFDRPVVTSSVRGRFSVNRAIPSCNLVAAFSAGPLAPCRIVWFSGDTGLHAAAPARDLRAEHLVHIHPRWRDQRPERRAELRRPPLDDHHRARPGDSCAESRQTGRQASPVDASISVSFSTAMDIAATEAAITVESCRARAHGWSATRAMRAASSCCPGATLEAGVTYQPARRRAPPPMSTTSRS